MRRFVPWAAVLLAIVFGIGWQSARLAARNAIAERNGRDLAPPRDSRPDDGRGRHGPSLFESIGDFAHDLGCDDAQRARLAAAMDEGTAEIARHEEAIDEAKAAARERVLAILTPEQRTRLEQLVAESFERRGRERVAADVAWLRQEGGVADASLEQVERILTDYEAAKRASWKPLDPSGAAGRRHGAREAVHRLREERDAKLAAVLDAATLERFREQRLHGRRGDGPPRGEPNRGPTEPDR